MKAVTLGRSALFTALVVSLAGCCSIIHGTRQDVGISSAPTGAIVKIDNVPSGNTPVVAKLTRKDNHFVRVELSGYQPFDMTLTRSVSGWVWGNIVFGGLIGLAVDAIDGAFYKLSPEQVSATLAANPASVRKASDGIYLFAVLNAEPEWVKVGQLQATQ
jgi:hypothetical protein